MAIRFHRWCIPTFISRLSFSSFGGRAAAQALPTTTTLTVTSNGAPVTSVTPNTAVTLTATVESGSAAVNSGPSQLLRCVGNILHRHLSPGYSAANQRWHGSPEVHSRH